MQKSRPAMTTKGSHRNTRESRRGIHPSNLLLAGALIVGGGIAGLGIYNVYQDSDIRPLQYEGTTYTITVPSEGKIIDYTKKCEPLTPYRDELYWADEIARLSGKESRFEIVNVGDRLVIPSVCQTSELGPASQKPPAK